MDLSSIFAYILKIAILLMNSLKEIPDEIDEKLKKNHNLLSRQISKTQKFLIIQQLFRLISIFSLIYSMIFYISLVLSGYRMINPLFPALPTFIGVLSFFLYILIRFIRETIVNRREYFLKEKQNLNYLSEEILWMVKIFSTKFRIFKKASKMRDLLFQNNDVSMVIKMGLILKKEKQSRLNALFYSILLLLYIIYFSRSIIIVGEWNSSEIIISFGFSLIFMVLSIIPSYFVLKQTNKWMKGYHELKDWGDLLDKYEIIPKQRYMALLDKDLNNLEKSSEE